ncbi:MAG: hypothetical protein WB992_04805 [Bryobacteraceae bacterium]
MPEANVDELKEFVESTSDRRVANNIMRHQYRVLTDQEKQWMQNIKDMGLAFIRDLHVLGGTADQFDAGEDRCGSRELSLAQTKMEEAVMWAVKHITR